MLDAIRRFLSGSGDPGRAAQPNPDDELRVAACALLLELAHSDDTFSPEEQRLIEESLGRHFGLSPEEGRGLLALADERRREAIDLHAFTRPLIARYDEGQRMVLAEIMWRVVDADGEFSRHEEAMMRKIASLLDLRPGYLAAARKRVAPDSQG
ncbi:MAG: TerB family tellurite resistance protein [Candidatus Eisenbacteria bacterium]